jgi:hypothetical protein
MGRERFTSQLYRECVGQVLELDEADKDAVACGPLGWFVTEEAELEGEMRALVLNRGIDSAGIELEVVKLVWRECGDGAVGRGADL